MFVDPSGHAWYHWAIAGALVVAAGVAVVLTAGGAAPAVAAVAMVAQGTAAATTATTVAAGAFMGSATVLTGAAVTAAMNSNSVDDFMAEGNWNTVGATFMGGLLNACYGFYLSQSVKASNASSQRTTTPNKQTKQNSLDSANIAKKIVNADRSGTALKHSDVYHRAGSFLSESQLAQGKAHYITGGDGIERILLQVKCEINGVNGIFEYILEPNGTVSHQLFTPFK